MTFNNFPKSVIIIANQHCLTNFSMRRFKLKCTTCKDMNNEKDFVYLVTVARSTLSMMFGWLYFFEKSKSYNLKQSPSP